MPVSDTHARAGLTSMFLFLDGLNEVGFTRELFLRLHDGERLLQFHHVHCTFLGVGWGGVLNTHRYAIKY